jgi:hypothetical protein
VGDITGSGRTAPQARPRGHWASALLGIAIAAGVFVVIPAVLAAIDAARGHRWADVFDPAKYAISGFAALAALLVTWGRHSWYSITSATPRAGAFVGRITRSV